MVDQLFYPSGAGNYQTIPLENPVGTPHWSILRTFTAGSTCYDGMPSPPNDDHMYVDWYYGSSGKDLYKFDEIGAVHCDGIRFHAWGANNAGGQHYYVVIKMPGLAEWNSSEWSQKFGWDGTSHEDILLDEQFVDGILTTNPLTGVAWEPSDFLNIQFGLWISEPGFGSLAIVGFAVELINFSEIGNDGRVGSIRHIYMPGVYKAEITLGGLSAGIDTPDLYVPGGKLSNPYPKAEDQIPEAEEVTLKPIEPMKEPTERTIAQRMLSPMQGPMHDINIPLAVYQNMQEAMIADQQMNQATTKPQLFWATITFPIRNLWNKLFGGK